MSKQQLTRHEQKVERTSYHVPVMLSEVLEYLIVLPGGTYIDCTLGGGGYAERILAKLEGRGKLYGFDTDPAAMQFAGERLKPFGDTFELVTENFADIREAMLSRGAGQVQGIVYDLGVSSHQLDTDSIGLSYRMTAPLDMRLDPRLEISAHDIINHAEADSLKKIFKRYGEEPMSGPIARRIVEARDKGTIETTTALRDIVTRGIREDKKNATLSRIFQALRIEVNHELESLERSLAAAIELLAPGGRLVVVTYHSLEDRIVKTMFNEASAPLAEPGSLVSLKETIDLSKATLRLVERKPVMPTESEIERNVRARSAKLRVAEKI